MLPPKHNSKKSDFLKLEASAVASDGKASARKGKVKINRKAAIIDDAFDDVGTREISPEKYLEFYQSANEEGEFDLILNELGLTIPEVDASEEPMDDFLAFLQVLWTHRRTNSKLAAMVDRTLFTEKVDKLIELETICQNLKEADLTLEVCQINSQVDNIERFASGEYEYVFIDYNLGIQPGPKAVANAKAKARAIYNKCPKGNKPVTILMSSESISTGLIDKFQEEQEMIEGVFRFSPKAKLRDRNIFSLLIRAYAQEANSSHALQEYIQTLTLAARGALVRFEKDVQSFRIEDYVFIQDSALRADDQPLGGYLAWLYSTHWANLLLHNTQLEAQQAIIDRVFAEEPPLHHRLPSPKVSNIYMSALFEEGLGPVGPHPLYTNSRLAKLPYLHLGDLFTKTGSTEVWMVLNAQCDLERPKEKNAGRSIFLVSGTLTPFDKLPAMKEHKTDFFYFEQNQYRIKWDVKHVVTVAHNQFRSWQRRKQLERHFRLRLPFALELQQEFSASLTRVGLPVSPPFTQEIALEVLFKNPDNTSDELLVKSTEYAFLPITKEGNKAVRLTLHFALDFKEALLTKQHALLDEIAALKGIPTAHKLKKTLFIITDLIDRFDNWFFDKPNFTYPSGNKPTNIIPNIIGLTLNAPKDILLAPYWFLFNITTIESESAGPTSTTPL